MTIEVKKMGMVLAGAAAVAFMSANLSGCATEMAAQNSTPATTQMQNSCKGVAYQPAADAAVEASNRQHHHHHHHHTATKHSGAVKATHKSKGSQCAGVAGQ